MSKKRFKSLSKFSFICCASFILLNARNDSAYAKELNASSIEEAKTMLSEASGNASEAEPYTVSVEAGNYTLNHEISIPNHTTLSFEKGAVINCKKAGEFAIRIVNADGAVVDGGHFFRSGYPC